MLSNSSNYYTGQRGGPRNGSFNQFEHAIVKTPEDAVVQRHIGSPTVQINGLDIDPGAREIKQFGVT